MYVYKYTSQRCVRHTTDLTRTQKDMNINHNLFIFSLTCAVVILPPQVRVCVLPTRFGKRTTVTHGC